MRGRRTLACSCDSLTFDLEAVTLEFLWHLTDNETAVSIIFDGISNLNQSIQMWDAHCLGSTCALAYICRDASFQAIAWFQAISDESFPDWSWFPDSSIKNYILKVAGFGKTCSNMHLLWVYRGKFRIVSIFSGLWFINHFHHWAIEGQWQNFQEIWQFVTKSLSVLRIGDHDFISLCFT